MKISLMELWNKFKSVKKIVLLSFAIGTICCLTYSACFIPQIYVSSIELELPAKIDINSANTIATILRGATFLEQDKSGSKVMHEVTLVPSGDIIHIDFSGTDYNKVNAFKEKFVEQAMLKSKGYVAEVYGTNKANQVEIIRDDRNYNGQIHPIKMINIYASLLLGVVTAFCVLVVRVVLERKNV